MNKTNIKKHSINDLLEALGDVPQSDGLYVYVGKEGITHRPFPYPFRSDNYSVFLLVSGSIKIQFNLITYNLQAGDMVLVSPHTVTHMQEIEEEIVMAGVSFTLNFAINSNVTKNEMDTFDFFASKTVPHLKLNKEEINSISNLIELLHKNNTRINPFYGREILTHSFNLLMYEIAVIYRTNNAEVKAKITRKEELTIIFFKLLEENFKKEKRVQFYSDALFMTAGHLSKTLKEVSGQTTGELIDAAIIMEARILLSNPSLSIAQIAEELNFSDQSFFGKFFKKHMKLSPSDYRKQE
ncbi:helix-turn-helix domain-containing protein [Flavobacterium sp. LHD-85]|uniref:helix-turn-helix domain-containing protein n=1 Tax=Flavobacterium sp. LHD-85 TaxID=3071410 RepID=UPI0027DF167D|nr:helix-turn-helix domain-containing protein [Flavobacterium sp. LHD-85]MDQ6530971.1 helix-turn-helix domain-containing protein [Flavobacterium sp. LHD-85]